MRGKKAKVNQKKKEAAHAAEDETVETTGKGRKKNILGSFSRKWTHNEQLMVRPCGIVIGRSTFYASENVVAVKVRSLYIILFRTSELIYRAHRSSSEAYSRQVCPD